MYTNATNSCKRVVKENGYKIDVVTELMKRRVFILCFLVTFGSELLFVGGLLWRMDTSFFELLQSLQKSEAFSIELP